MIAPRTVIIICGDFRLRERDDELYRYYHRLDGKEPFRTLIPGACLPFQEDVVLKRGLLPFLKKGANHIHLEDHMGIDADTPGCAAFEIENAETYGDLTPYHCKVEEQDHVVALDKTAKRFDVFLESHGFEATINTGLYRHNAVGFGSTTLHRSDRQLALPSGNAAFPHLLRRH